MREIWFDGSRCVACLTCALACAIEHTPEKSLFTALRNRAALRSRMEVRVTEGFLLPVQCRHCSNPPCLYACMASAVSRDGETGIVSVDGRRCVSCLMCVMVCPLGAISVSGDGMAPLRCDRCPERDVPACVAACPTQALTYERWDGRMARQRNAAAAGVYAVRGWRE
ncbi:MAG: 4Fe-4S dicluster domain-containing protein [Bacillota bacterium]|uniref:4Fe-4S dicluster domain-containing protein n=2 Tax=Candidatus Desulforudis TaxID=471826 RepID=UPI0034986C93